MLLFLLITGCSQKNEFQAWQDKSIKKLLIEDRKNKELELVYLKEIRIAQENNDEDSYRYFFQEYIKIPRLNIPDHLKEHPDYFIGGDRVKY
tara:strand:+ start:106 stop:381 length:276 start_codon:yes stop_codon:yes gene_type:complete